MKKRFTSLIFALALALLVLPAQTFAQEAATITVSDASAKAGETVEMVVVVETDSGISGAGITVEYNKTAMTLTEIRPLVSGTFLADVEYDSFSWLKGKNLSGTFELATLCFSIDASANGDYIVEVKPIGDFAANITNEDASTVAATFVPGTLSIGKEGAGNADGPVTEDPEPSGTVGEDKEPSATDPKPGSTLDVEASPTKAPEADPEKNEPQPSPSTPTEEPEKKIGDIGLYIAIIAAAAVGFMAGTVRKKRK